MVITSIVFAMFVVAGIVVLGNLEGTSAQCGADLPSLISKCGSFVDKQGPKIPPSAECCEVVKSLDVSCVCENITPAIEARISVEKAIYVAETCGASVPPKGTKCGSYTIPPHDR